MNDFLVEDQNADTLFFVEKLIASVDLFKFQQRNISLSSVSFLSTKVYFSLDEKRFPNYKFLLDAIRTPNKQSETKPWDVTCQNFIFKDTQLGYSYYQKDDINLIDLKNIELDVSDLILNKDSIALKINQLSFDDNKSFTLNDLSTEVVSYNHVIKLNNLKISTPYSKIVNANFTIDQTSLNEEKDYTDSEIDIDLQESIIHLQDVSQIVPALKGMDLQVNLSGHVYGTIADLKAKELALSFGDHTQILCDFYVNGLPDLDNAFITIDLKNSVTDFLDIAKIKLPNSSEERYLNFPSMLYDAGIIQYKGNFTGFLSDFVSYGTLQSNFGYLNTDLSFSPGKNKALDINGHLKTVNFKIGQFSQINDLGKITFNGQIDGSYNPDKRSFSANIDGLIDSLLYRDYQYKNIILDGLVDDQKFEGNLSIDDENLNGNFVGKVDFNQEFPVFDFELLLNKANLVVLNIDRTHKESNLAIDLKANFTGNTIDNINGNIWFEEGIYSNENNSFVLNSLNLSTFDDSLKNLQLSSDFLDVSVSGRYSFRSIKQSFENLIYQYIPASGIEFAPTLGENKFNFDLDIKNAEPITQTFLPSLSLSPAQIIGSYDEANNNLDLYSDVSVIKYNNLTLNNYSLALHTNDKLEIESTLNELQFGENQSLHNLSLLTDATNNGINTKIVWDNYKEEEYSGELETEMRFSRSDTGSPHLEMNVLPTSFILSDSLWNIHPSTISIDSTRIEFNDLKISNSVQFFLLSGAISTNREEQLDISINNFNLNNIDLISTKKINLFGELNGTVSLFDVYKKAYLVSDINVTDVNYNGQDVGDISVLSKWDNPSESLQSELIITNDSIQTIYGYGSYIPSKDSMDFTVHADRLPLSLLQSVLTSSFQDIHGLGTGEIKIYGSPKNILFRGDILGENTGLTLKFLQVGYEFNDFVKFRGDSIIFDKITIFDPDGNQGIFDGSIRHDNFSNMDYDLSFSSPKILAINTTIRDNERFYGKAYGNGIVQITGHGKEIYIDGSATTMSGTAIDISLDYEEEAQVYDFIRFINTNEPEKNTLTRKTNTSKSKVYMKFDVEATPDAKFQLIYNSQIGDVIKAQGSGNVQISIDPNFDISMYGDYRVERGDYLFTLQNVINKKFEIEEGGTIAWSGDAYDANININALYQLKASLNELYAGSDNSVDYNQRIPVICNIKLTNNLSNPTINFDIEFPTTEDRITDEVSQFFTTEEDMNRQILSLLVLGRFYTPEYLRGSYKASNTNIVGTTASELFSNQLSNWLSQISNDFDIGVNYRPGNQISNDEIEFALSTQIFNDRVTLNGNIGNNGTQTTTTNNNNIVGDFDLSVKLTNNGNLQFKAYNHSNNNIIYETSPYTQGIGLSYRHNYNTFNELWQKMTQLFKWSK